MSSRLQSLIALAKEPSSERRRELLRNVTDMFFEGDGYNTAETALFDAVMGQLADEMEAAVRAELSTRLSMSHFAPPQLARRLANDNIEVAAPMLCGSAALSDDDLLQVVQERGQDHLRAISLRTTVSTRLSDAIVERGDDDTLGVLLRNNGAELSRQAHETVVDRAHANPALHAAVVNRASVPIDLLNEMYFKVEADLREQILQRNAEINPADLEAALRAGRHRVAVQDGAFPADYDEAEKYVRNLKVTGGVTPQALAGMLRAKQTTRFLVALAELADVDFHTARRILERRELDVLAIVCKAAGFARALFLTFVMLILDGAVNVMERAREYGQTYNDLPPASARRTIQFWKLRRQTGDVAAA